MILISVDFPAPLRPRIPSFCPRWTSKLTRFMNPPDALVDGVIFDDVDAADHCTTMKRLTRNVMEIPISSISAVIQVSNTML